MIAKLIGRKPTQADAVLTHEQMDALPANVRAVVLRLEHESAELERRIELARAELAYIDGEDMAIDCPSITYGHVCRALAALNAAPPERVAKLADRIARAREHGLVMKSTDEIMRRVAGDAARARAEAMAQELDKEGAFEQAELNYVDEIARLIDAYFRHTEFQPHGRACPAQRFEPKAVEDE